MGSTSRIDSDAGTLLKPPTVEECGSSLTVETVLQRKANTLTAAMKRMFGNGCELSEALGHSVRFSVPDLSVSKAFKDLATAADELGLESYSVNQVTSLEQVFIGFAGSSADEEL